MFGLVLCATAAASLIGAGFWLRGKRVREPRAVLAYAAGMSVFLVFTGALLSLAPAIAYAAQPAPTASAYAAAGMAFLAAGICTGLACVGTGLAVSSVGAASLGLVGEKPEMLGITLIYVGLAEGIAIYGVIISLLIMGKV